MNNQDIKLTQKSIEQEKEMYNLWLEIGNACLLRAQGILEKGTTTTNETIVTVSELVRLALISIDNLSRFQEQ